MDGGGGEHALHFNFVFSVTYVDFTFSSSQSDRLSLNIYTLKTTNIYSTKIEELKFENKISRQIIHLGAAMQLANELYQMSYYYDQ